MIKDKQELREVIQLFVTRTKRRLVAKFQDKAVADSMYPPCTSD
jgi:hypothetical protein